MRILAVVGSAADGATARAAREVLDAAARQGASCDLIALGRAFDRERIDAQVAALVAADGVILATPIYRATYAGVMKEFIDHIPRSGPAEGCDGPLRGKPVAVVGAGASAHHFLGLDPLITLLMRFFGAWVIPPGLYAIRDEIDADQVQRFGSALTAMAGHCLSDQSLNDLRPQV